MEYVNTASVTLPIPAVPSKKPATTITKSNALYVYDDALKGYDTVINLNLFCFISFYSSFIYVLTKIVLKVFPKSATYSLAATATKKRGSRSVSFTPSANGLIKFRASANFQLGEVIIL